jgi:cytidine deaminase
MATTTTILNQKSGWLQPYRNGMFMPAEARQAFETSLNITSHQSKMDFFLAILNEIEHWYLGHISQFKVGVCGVDGVGNVYFGVNAEFPNTAINTTIHAEQFLVTNVFNNGGTELVHIFLKASPCGHCRQFLSETIGSQLMITVFHDGINETRELNNLLPFSFGPADLGVTTRLLQPERDYEKSMTALQMDKAEQWAAAEEKTTTADETAEEKTTTTDESTKEVNGRRRAAVDAAKKAFAPFTGVHEGCALVCDNGEICVGSSMESAAFNPSLIAVQGALIEVYRRGMSFTSIRSATIVSMRPEHSVGPDYVEYGKILLKAVCEEDCSIDAMSF